MQQYKLQLTHEISHNCPDIYFLLLGYNGLGGKEQHQTLENFQKNYLQKFPYHSKAQQTKLWKMLRNLLNPMSKRINKNKWKAQLASLIFLMDLFNFYLKNHFLQSYV